MQHDLDAVSDACASLAGPEKVRHNMANDLQMQALDAALEGQPGGRRIPGEPIAWCVEETEESIALDIGRWAGTGRVTHRRFVWSTQLSALVATPLWAPFSAFGRDWVFLTCAPWDVRPADSNPDDWKAECSERSAKKTELLCAAALTPIKFDHAPALSAKAKARAEGITRYNGHRTRKIFADAVMWHCPPGYQLLPVPFGATPKLYRIRYDAGTSQMPKAVVVVRRPKALIALGKVEASDPKGWREDQHEFFGKLVRIHGADYYLAPDGHALYRPGEAEDCWSFPEDSAEAQLRFREMMPPFASKIPGALAWYTVGPNRRVVQIAWVNARREVVTDTVGVGLDGLLAWRGRGYWLLSDGVVVPIDRRREVV